MRNKTIVTWGELLLENLAETGDKLVYCTLSTEELNKEFDCGFGGSSGKEFTAWGERYVYFPVVYDGAEWIGKTPRNPCDETTPHMGGE